LRNGHGKFAWSVTGDESTDCNPPKAEAKYVMKVEQKCVRASSAGLELRSVGFLFPYQSIVRATLAKLIES